MAKSFFTYEQQLDKLQNEKHLTINDTKYAKETLQKLSYYSLIVGYKNLFKHPASGKYIHGVTFEEVVAFYYFDEELRTLFLKYILHIERHIKSLLSYYFCAKHGDNQFEYLNPSNYNLSKNKITLVARCRNVCAHGERLYSFRIRENIPDMPLHIKLRIPKKNGQFIYGKNDLFAVVLALRYLVGNDEFKTFKHTLLQLINDTNKNCPHISKKQLLTSMGFPENWDVIMRYKK